MRQQAMKVPRIEPPPLPRDDFERSLTEALQQENRVNPIMLAGVLAIVAIVIISVSILFGGGVKPTGIGAAKSPKGDVGEVEDSAESRPNGAMSSSQLKADIKDVAEAFSESGGRFAASGEGDQVVSVSPSEEGMAVPVEESIISLPSGKLKGDAVPIALGDAFNPFLESANGNDIVYVIDVSGSMRGERYVRVCDELIEAIDGLKDRQRFNIVLFSTIATVFHQEGLVVATHDVKRAAAGWLRNQSCGGGTDPSDAMEAAILMTPQKIVILSDGEFDGMVPVYITSLNHSLDATIDCIGFDPQSLTLKEIATNNGPGRFYYVK